MAGPTPITAPHRVTFFYTGAAFPHKLRFFASAIASGTDPSGWALLARSGATGFKVIADAVAVLLAGMLSNGGGDGVTSALLEVRNPDGSFSPLVSEPEVVAGSAGAPPIPGEQFTISFKDTNNKKQSVITVDGVEIPPLKTANPLLIQLGPRAWYLACTGAGANPTTTDPWGWMRGRDGNGPVRAIFASVTLNRKLERKHHTG